MQAIAQYRKGLAKAIEVTGISSRKASIKAGFNENQINRFVSGEHDIKLGTLDKICELGFGLPMETVFRMGK